MAEPGSIETDRRAPAAWQDGTDPAGWADTAGATDPFPPPLDLDVRPPDGPWVDAGLLGRVEDAAEQPAEPPPTATRRPTGRRCTSRTTRPPAPSPSAGGLSADTPPNPVGRPG
jgi:hypothetical protein